MDPKFQTSFIPKKPLLDSSKPAVLKREEAGNIFNTIAGVIFTLTLLTLIGLYGYQYFLKKQIASASTKISEARAEFGIDKIQEVINKNSRLSITKNILEKHILLSNLIASFQASTLVKTRFSNLQYTGFSEGKGATVQLSIEDKSYNALARQEEVFQNDPSFKNVSFANFSLLQNGYVSAQVSAEVSPDLISYKSLVDKQTKASNPQASTPAAQ
jgi:hypothetical protein